MDAMIRQGREEKLCTEGSDQTLYIVSGRWQNSGRWQKCSLNRVQNEYFDEIDYKANLKKNLLGLPSLLGKISGKNCKVAKIGPK